MNNERLVESFADFKDFKNIDRVTMMRVLEEVFRTTLRKKFGTDENFDIVINAEKGDLEIWRNRTIVADDAIEDPISQIAYSDAIKIEPDFEIGEDLPEEVTINSFGRRAIQAAKQNLFNRILELEKEGILQKYKDREGEVVSGEVYQVWKKEILVLDDEGNELLLPKTEQIPNDHFKKGDSIQIGSASWRGRA